MGINLYNIFPRICIGRLHKANQYFVNFFSFFVNYIAIIKLLVCRT